MAFSPGVDPGQWRRRWSSEAHGPERTIISADRSYVPLDVDAHRRRRAASSTRVKTSPRRRSMCADLLAAALRDVDLIVTAASSTGFKPGHISLHAYVLFDRPAPLPAIYRWLAGAKASGLPLDPRPALCGQLFLTGRPLLAGLDDPVPEPLRAFVLPGRRRAATIDWNEFSAPLAAREASERRAHTAGAELGWRAILGHYLGDGGERLGFFQPLSMALGYAARSARR